MEFTLWEDTVLVWFGGNTSFRLEKGARPWLQVTLTKELVASGLLGSALWVLPVG